MMALCLFPREEKLHQVQGELYTSRPVPLPKSKNTYARFARLGTRKPISVHPIFERPEFSSSSSPAVSHHLSLFSLCSPRVVGCMLAFSLLLLREQHQHTHISPHTEEEKEKHTIACFLTQLINQSLFPTSVSPSSSPPWVLPLPSRWRALHLLLLLIWWWWRLHPAATKRPFPSCRKFLLLLSQCSHCCATNERSAGSLLITARSGWWFRLCAAFCVSFFFVQLSFFPRPPVYGYLQDPCQRETLSAATVLLLSRS